METYDLEPMLRVVYEIELPLSSQQSAKLMTDLSNAFVEFVQFDAASPDNMSILFARSGAGSFFLDFMAVTKDVIDIYEKRLVLMAFVKHMKNVLTYFVSGQIAPGIPVHTEVVASLKSIADPVEKREAKKVEIFVFGDNNHIVIDSETAARLFGPPQAGNRFGLQRWNNAVASKTAAESEREIVGRTTLEGGSWRLLVSSNPTGVTLRVVNGGVTLVKNRRYSLRGRFSSDVKEQQIFEVTSAKRLND